MNNLFSLFFMAQLSARVNILNNVKEKYSLIND